MPPKYIVSQVIGFLKEKLALKLALKLLDCKCSLAEGDAKGCSRFEQPVEWGRKGENQLVEEMEFAN